MGAKPYAKLSKLRPLVLRESPDLLPDRLALQDPERPGKPSGQIANDFRAFLEDFERKERAENAPRHRRKPKVNSCFYNLPPGSRQGLVCENHCPRGQYIWAGGKPGDRIAQPTDDALV